jgi:hypothetical protein
MLNNKKLIFIGLIMSIAGSLIYLYDSPNYKFLEFLSKYITSAGIIIAILAYYATTHKDMADENRSRNAIAFNLINQWQILPFTDYRKDIFKMERIDAVAKELIDKENAGDFASMLVHADNAHYRSSLVCVLNFFEHMAISIERKVVDEDYIKDFFKSIFIDYHSIYRFYITYERKKESRLWIKFSNLAEKWNR